MTREGDVMMMSGEDVELELRLDPRGRAPASSGTRGGCGRTPTSPAPRGATWTPGHRPFVRFDESGPHGGRLTSSNGCMNVTGRWREWNGAPTITRSRGSGSCGARPTDQEIAIGNALGEPVLELRTTNGAPELVVRYAHANSPAELVYRR